MTSEIEVVGTYSDTEEHESLAGKYIKVLPISTILRDGHQSVSKAKALFKERPSWISSGGSTELP